MAFYSVHMNGENGLATDVAWNVESGAGVILSKGYASLLVRIGTQIRLGQRFLIDVGGAYSLPTTISIRQKYKYTTPGGIGADAAFGIHF